MISLSTNVLGAFALKNGRIIAYERFPEEPGETAQILAKTRDDICEQEQRLLTKLIASGTKEFAVDNPNRFYGLSLNASFTLDENPLDVFTIAQEMGVDRRKVQELIYTVNLQSTKTELAAPDRDQLAIQAVKSLDELEDEINTLSERLREWYSMHFPELNHLVVRHEVFARLISEAGNRAGMGDVKCGLDQDFQKKIAESAETSFGFDITEADARILQTQASSILSLTETKRQVESYLQELMKEIAPNTTSLLEPQLAARLIAQAGSLTKLSKMPAGTIQILGAEDAFFRFLKSGDRPPKHGIIFNYPAIRGSPKNIRGKIARTLSAKIAIAAKTDAFHGAFIGEKLKQQMEARVKAVKKGS